MDPYEILDELRTAIDLVQQGDELNEEEEREVKFALHALEKMLIGQGDEAEEGERDVPRRQKFGQSILGSSRR